MVYTPSESPWSSNRRLALFLPTTIFIFSLVTLGLAITYVRELYLAPLQERHRDEPQPERWPVAWYIFYAPFLPLCTIFHSAFETALIRTQRPNTLYSLLAAWVFMSGWVVQIMFWWMMDVGCYDTGFTCPQTYNEFSDHDGGDYTYELFPGADTRVTIAKMCFGHAILALYFFYVPVTAFALQKSWMLKRTAAIGRKERKVEELELQTFSQP